MAAATSQPAAAAAPVRPALSPPCLPPGRWQSDSGGRSRGRVESADEQVREAATRSLPLAIRECTIEEKQVAGVRQATPEMDQVPQPIRRPRDPQPPGIPSADAGTIPEAGGGPVWTAG